MAGGVQTEQATIKAMVATDSPVGSMGYFPVLGRLQAGGRLPWGVNINTLLSGGAQLAQLMQSAGQMPVEQAGANQVKNGLNKAVPGINVLLNPGKPRRGCFEILEEGGETFISLLNSSFPLSPLGLLQFREAVGLHLAYLIK